MSTDEDARVFAKKMLRAMASPNTKSSDSDQANRSLEEKAHYVETTQTIGNQVTQPLTLSATLADETILNQVFESLPPIVSVTREKVTDEKGGKKGRLKRLLSKVTSPQASFKLKRKKNKGMQPKKKLKKVSPRI